MKCQGCGHDYPGTLTRCPRCKLKNQERAQSTVLQFPTPPSTQDEKREASLPDWRVELNERLKEIRAKRSATNNVEVVKPRVETRYTEEPAPKPRTITSSSAATGARLAPVTSTQSASTNKSSNQVVEAALNRVRTASENASRTAGQESQPRPINSGAVVMDKDATAKALAPEVAPHREENIAPGRVTRTEERNDFRTQSTPATATRRAVSPPHYEADDLPEMGEVVSAYSAGPALEMEPRDYLAEEINKLRTQSMQEAAERLPSVGTHFIIGTIDLLVVAISCAPFIALIRIVGGSLTNTAAIVAAGSMGLMISLFYFSITQSLTGKTFGMMLTSTRLVDAYTQEHPSIWQNVLRTVGYLIAVAPAMIGLLWIAISSDRRGWQDYISGTLVIRD